MNTLQRVKKHFDWNRRFGPRVGITRMQRLRRSKRLAAEFISDLPRDVLSAIETDASIGNHRCSDH